MKRAAILDRCRSHLCLAAASAQHIRRIKFSRGAVSTVVVGGLSGYGDKDVYFIRVRKGQRIRTEQIMAAGNRDITIYIKDPKTQDVGDSDASCNNRREISPTMAGDYRLEIVECRKADKWKGVYRFRVTVDQNR